MLEKLLCSNEEPSGSITQSTKSTCQDIPDLEEYVHNFYTGYPNCKEFIVDFYTVTRNTGNNMDEVASDAVQSLDEGGKVDRSSNGKRDRDGRRKKRSGGGEGGRREGLNLSSDGCVNNAACDSGGEKTQPNDGESVGERRMRYERETLSNALCDDAPFSHDCDSISNGGSNVLGSDTAARNDAAASDESGASNAAEEDSSSFITLDVTQMLEGCSDNIEIPQTQYLLNQVTRESAVDGETPAHIPENSLPDLDSKKLISEANKTLSNLLLDSGECQNEISEQTDSGICTVISSENTSLYDKSPEEKKTFANEIEQDGECGVVLTDGEDTQENTSYSCSNVNSPKKKNPTITENSCVCGTRGVGKVVVPAALDHSIDVSGLNGDGEPAGKNVPRISSNFDGTNEEFIGVAYGNGQLTLCDSNQSTFQINYSENWENLNLNIDASSSRKEFWGDLKCENCPSTSQSIDKIGSKIERYAQEKITAKRTREERQRRRHQHKLERNAQQRAHHGRSAEKRQNLQIMRSATSTESSRSNSTDRCLNPRLNGFGAGLHLGQSTRQMPNFGSHSPHMSPRLHHFETRSTPGSAQHCCNLGTHGANRRTSPQSRKLLDHRRSKSEQIARMKRRDVEKRERHERDKYARTEHSRRKPGGGGSSNLINDGLGPRTDKSGLATEPASANAGCQHARDNHLRRSARARLVNASTVSGVSIGLSADQSSGYKADVASSSSCSSFCDSSSETSEFHSDCQDDEEIALAMQAAEIANRNQIRAKFR